MKCRNDLSPHTNCPYISLNDANRYYYSSAYSRGRKAMTENPASFNTFHRRQEVIVCVITLRVRE